MFQDLKRVDGEGPRYVSLIEL